jgi:hypothetical protein
MSESMSSSNKWCVDLVQHLRTVHFALVLLACGLISVGVGYSRSATSALPIVEQISSICSKWPDDWVENLRPSDMRPTNLPQTLYFYLPPGRQYAMQNRGPDILPTTGGLRQRWVEIGKSGGGLITKGLKGVKLTLKKPLRSWTDAERIVESPGYRGTAPAVLSTMYLERAPTTLSEFQDWWDKARALRVTYFTVGPVNDEDYTMLSRQTVDNQWFSQNLLLFSSPLKIPDKGLSTLPDVDLTSARPILSTMGQSSLVVEIRMPKDSPARLSVPINGFREGVETDPWRLNPLWSRRSGSFVEAFPELQAIQAELSVLRLDSLRAKLEAQASEAQTLELGGLKFQVARWGILLILMIQLYFWLLVRELNEKLNPGDAATTEVAWLGLFVSRVGRLAFLCSLLVPTVAVFLLAHQLLHLMYQLGVTALSLSLSVLSFVQLPRAKDSAS